MAAGPGVVWTADSDPKRGLSRLLRWDGQWSDVAVPEPYNWVTQLLVATDGAVWATFDGRMWAKPSPGTPMVGGRSTGVRPAVWRRPPPGRCASIRDAGVACYDAAGLAAGAPVSTYPVEVGALSIAPDGSAWVLGEQVARLPEGATGAAG